MTVFSDFVKKRKKLKNIINHPDNTIIHISALKNYLKLFVKRSEEMGISKPYIDQEYWQAFNKIEEIERKKYAISRNISNIDRTITST
ncbi:MAG TPA: hypothetical protein ENH06_01635 [bacterium]|nr:hypothetical protein [bacterium]